MNIAIEQQQAEILEAVRNWYTKYTGQLDNFSLHKV